MSNTIRINNNNLTVNDDGTITLADGTVTGAEMPGMGSAWDNQDSTEVFNDNFSTFSGWTVYNDYDTTSTPSIDTSMTLLRAKGANPCIDATIRSRGLIIQPENNTSNTITLVKDISGSLNFAQAWTIVTKVSMPMYYQQANNSFGLTLGVSLPGNNNARYNAVSIALDNSGVGDAAIKWGRQDDGVGTMTTWDTTDRILWYNSIWYMLVHQNASSDVHVYTSYDGQIMSELSKIVKDPATFTHLYFNLGGIKQGDTLHHHVLHYVRAYQSEKFR